MIAMSGIVYLSEDDLIGRGAERAVYRIPDNPRLCVKITYNIRSKRKSLQNDRDSEFYHWLEKKNICWTNLARCYGWQETNLGKGLVFDFVADDFGCARKRLDFYRDSKKLSDEYIFKQLLLLRQYCLDNHIILCDLTLENIVFDSDVAGDCKLILVDGVGNTDLLTVISSNISILARRKIMRKWRRFLKKHFSHINAD